MVFPLEIFAHIKDYMLNYKYTFSRKILPLLVFEKASKITKISSIDLWGKNWEIHEISYAIPRYLEYNISEDRLKKLGFTHYGLNRYKKDEKIYLYLTNKNDWTDIRTQHEQCGNRKRRTGINK